MAKGASMDALVEKVKNRMKAAILIGADRELIATALNKICTGSSNREGG
ncbi:MAG: hypothetical protein WDO06_10060 [Actinomycetota bacterium]